ncbi:cell division protein FtsX [Fodinicurvata halophila]|uniref:Cell division protein FtsX n=1 Tax=Fodinicurvata halophila TaxID=1419723 RepID=A0ABV8ULX9_9PROT
MIRLRRRPRDLPLARDASARFLPWLIAFMVYLAAIALVSALAAQKIAARWDQDLSGRITIQVPHAALSESANPAEAADMDALVDYLVQVPAVHSVDVLGPQRSAELVEPWLGDLASEADLPIPQLITLELRADQSLPAEFESQVTALAPGAQVDDHQRWIGGLLDFAQSIQTVALLVVLLVGAAAVITVIFVTRTGLSIHRQMIELLHLIGARDRYVAAQFQAHAFRLGLGGGLIGLLAAVATLIGLDRLVDRQPTALLPDLSLGYMDWALLLILPIFTAVVALVTARITVLRTLARLT